MKEFTCVCGKQVIVKNTFNRLSKTELVTPLCLGCWIKSVANKGSLDLKSGLTYNQILEEMIYRYNIPEQDIRNNFISGIL